VLKYVGRLILSYAVYLKIEKEEKMKKIFLPLGIVLVCLVTITSCSLFTGKDGVAYVKVTYDAYTSYSYTVDGFLAQSSPFPSTWTSDTNYQIAAGTYTMKYVLGDNEWADMNSDGYSDYVTVFNDAAGTIVWTDYFYTSSWSPNFTYYWNNDFSSRANSFSYTVTINKGALFFKDGADKYFTLNLAWITSNTSISSSEVPASSMKIIEDSPTKVVKELTDGAYTLRLEIMKAPQAGSSNIEKAKGKDGGK
jgi:hypothetical protein